MTEDQMNPDICPSALEEDGTLDRTKWDGAHKWDEMTIPNECAECGALREPELNIRCNNCMTCYTEEQLEPLEDMRACPKCKTDEYLMDLTV